MAGKRNEATLWLNLYAEDWPVFHKTIGVQPGEIGKAHCITTKSVHIFITARLWGKQKKNPTQTRKLGAWVFILLCSYLVHQVGGWEQTPTGHSIAGFSQLCTCISLRCPLSTPVFSFLKTVTGTQSASGAAFHGCFPAHAKKDTRERPAAAEECVQLADKR